MRYFYIYEITNLLNGKTYVGQRHAPKNCMPENDVKYMGSGMILKNAIKKNGVEHFRKRILAVCHNQETLDALEIAFIKLYREIGKAEYNIQDGGHFVTTFNGGSRSEEGKKLWKDKIIKFYSNPDYLKIHGEKIKNSENFKKRIKCKDYIEKLSVASKKMWENRSSEELKKLKEKMSKNMKGIRKSESARKNIGFAIRNSKKFQDAMKSEEHRRNLSKSISSSKKHWESVHSESFIKKMKELAAHRTPAQIQNSKNFGKVALGRRRFTTPDGEHLFIKPEFAKENYVRGWL